MNYPLNAHRSRLMSHVPRWGILPTQRSQNIAEHSYFVVLYTLEICGMLELSMEDTYKMVVAAIFHDMAEIETSDIPGPIKRKIADFEALDQLEEDIFTEMGYEPPKLDTDGQNILKAADYWDSAAFLAMEVGYGNKHIHQIYLNQRENFMRRMNALGLQEQFEDIDKGHELICTGNGFKYPKDKGVRIPKHEEPPI